jgi:hypothetical protein
MKIAPWTGFAFCAFLSGLALFGFLDRDSRWWQPAFYSFLPMCFFYVGSVLASQNKELRELRQRLAELEQAKPH